MTDKVYEAPLDGFRASVELKVLEDGTMRLFLCETEFGEVSIKVSPEFAAAWIKEFNGAKA